MIFFDLALEKLIIAWTGASKAEEICYNVINVLGSKHGNCGHDNNGNYVICAAKWEKYLAIVIILCLIIIWKIWQYTFTWYLLTY